MCLIAKKCEVIKAPLTAYKVFYVPYGIENSPELMSFYYLTRYVINAAHYINNEKAKQMYPYLLMEEKEKYFRGRNISVTDEGLHSFQTLEAAKTFIFSQTVPPNVIVKCIIMPQSYVFRGVFYLGKNFYNSVASTSLLLKEAVYFNNVTERKTNKILKYFSEPPVCKHIQMR